MLQIDDLAKGGGERLNNQVGILTHFGSIWCEGRSTGRRSEEGSHCRSIEFLRGGSFRESDLNPLGGSHPPDSSRFTLQSVQ